MPKPKRCEHGTRLTLMCPSCESARIIAAMKAAKETPQQVFNGIYSAGLVAPPVADANPKSAFGIKKPPLHLVPDPALIELAMVMGLGAKKYGPFNWRDTAVPASVYIAAARRHLASWFDGESIDEESGASHLAHAAACMFILLDAIAVGKLIDDRPPVGVAARRIRELTAK